MAENEQPAGVAAQPVPIADAAPPPNLGLSRGWRLVLILSLGLNLLVVGLAMGAMTGGHRGPFGGMDLATGPLVDALSDADREAIRRDLFRQGRMERDGRGEAQAGMTPILAALRAEPFDPAALTQALSGLRSRAERATDLAEQVLVSRVAAMSPAERLAFADRIAARAQEGRRRD